MEKNNLKEYECKEFHDAAEFFRDLLIENGGNVEKALLEAEDYFGEARLFQIKFVLFSVLWQSKSQLPKQLAAKNS